MRTHRFVIADTLAVGDLVVREPEIINQWRNVLRFTPGQEMILTDGHGRDAQAILMEYNDQAARVTIEQVTDVSEAVQAGVTLYCAVLKKENFELVCQKATEIGVHTIVPVITARTVKLGINEDRINKIITEAVEQSGQSVLPNFQPVTTFETVLRECDASKKILFDIGGVSVERSNGCVVDSAIFIGPEGGFTEEERAQAVLSGWQIVSLGITTLRGETAAIIASYLAVHGSC